MVRLQRRLFTTLIISLVFHSMVIYGINATIKNSSGGPAAGPLEVRLQLPSNEVKDSVQDISLDQAPSLISKKIEKPREKVKPNKVVAKSDVQDHSKQEQASTTPSLSIASEVVDPTYYSAKQLDVLPKPRSPVHAMFPQSARDAHIAKGRVILLALINERGEVDDISIVSAEPEGFFEDAAMDAVKQAQFTPAQKDGRVVKSRGVIEVNFD